MSNIWTALAKAQQNFGPVGTSGRNPHFRSTYATLGDIHKATRRALLEAGLVVTSAPGQTEDGMFVECTIAHAESGETVSQRCPLLVGKQDMQGLGSAISYARRYLLLSMLDLDMDGLDDDGEAAKVQTQRPQPKRPQKPQAPRGFPRSGDSQANGTTDANDAPQDAVEAPDNPFTDKAESDDYVEIAPGEWANRLSEKQKNTLHALGSELYSDKWDGVRHRNVKKVTNGRTESSNELSSGEADKLIAGMLKLKKQAAAKVAA